LPTGLGHADRGSSAKRDETGETIKVVRAVATVDCGRTINPDGASNQVEGGIVQAVSWVLKEQVRFDRTRITARTWDDYPILRFSEAPPSRSPSSTGRTNLRSVSARRWPGRSRRRSPNAVFDAIGVRVRSVIDAQAHAVGDQRRMTGG
jgi:xanthine dehydrogenase molybdopterin-binding subunit B